MEEDEVEQMRMRMGMGMLMRVENGDDEKWARAARCTVACPVPCAPSCHLWDTAALRAYLRTCLQ